MRNCPNSPIALSAAERILKPGGRLVIVSFPLAGRPYRQDLPCRAQPRRRRFASRAGSYEVLRRPSWRLTKKPVIADERKSRPIRVRDRPSCAPPSAPISQRAKPTLPIFCRVCHPLTMQCGVADDHPHHSFLCHRRDDRLPRRMSMTSNSESTMQAERLGQDPRRNPPGARCRRGVTRNGPSSIHPIASRGWRKRHLPLKPTDARQFDQFTDLPERPKPPLFADQPDPIGALLSIEQEQDIPTGSTGARGAR